MERNPHSGVLNSAQFNMASPADDAEIRALLREVPMEGSLRIGWTREPSYFACPDPAGMSENTLVARREGKIVSVGAWSEGEMWVRGTPNRVGYLHGLRIRHGTPGSMRVLRDGYATLAECLKDSSTAGWFTSIDASNTRARRVLESRASGLPRYTRLANYRTRIWPVSRRGDLQKLGNVESRSELAEFLHAESARFELALTWSGCRWKVLERNGFTIDDCVVVKRRGRIVAAAGLWDQSAWKQIVVYGYPPRLARLRPWIARCACRLGWPALPEEGGCLRMGRVFPFAVSADGCSAMPELWRGLESLARARGIDWLALGLDAGDALWRGGRPPRVGTDYHTILYQVSGAGFPGGVPLATSNTFRPDCALL